MKQIIYILLATTTLGLMSCSDWSDVPPKTSILTNKQFESESGFRDTPTGIYLKSGTQTLYAEDLTYAYLDELAGLYSDYPGYNTNAVFDQNIAFDYENTFLSKKNGIYSTVYSIIANINSLLEHIDKNEDALITEHCYETMKGGAFGLHASLHSDLLRMFGPVYKGYPASKAIPCRTTFDKDVIPVLVANEAVDVILKDLNDVEKLPKENDPLDSLTDQTDGDLTERNSSLVSRELRMNLYVVKVILARVYCYKRDAESKGLTTEYAKEVIATSKYFALYKPQIAPNYDSIHYTERIFGVTVDEFSNLLTGNYMDMGNTNAQQRFYLNEDKLRFFYETVDAGDTDWRKNTEMFEVANEASQTDTFRGKYSQKSLNGGYACSSINAVPLIRLPEVYYIVTECAFSTSESTDVLNTVHSMRDISYDDKIMTIRYDGLGTTSEEDKNQTRRINEIVEEYRKEYFAEGQPLYFLEVHNYSAYHGYGVETMIEAHCQMTSPDNGYIFGNNSK